MINRISFLTAGQAEVCHAVTHFYVCLKWWVENSCGWLEIQAVFSILKPWRKFNILFPSQRPWPRPTLLAHTTSRLEIVLSRKETYSEGVWLHGNTFASGVHSRAKPDQNPLLQNATNITSYPVKLISICFSSTSVSPA